MEFQLLLLFPFLQLISMQRVFTFAMLHLSWISVDGIVKVVLGSVAEDSEEGDREDVAADEVDLEDVAAAEVDWEDAAVDEVDWVDAALDRVDWEDVASEDDWEDVSSDDVALVVCVVGEEELG